LDGHKIYLVLHIDRERCRKADATDIAIRWHQLFKAKEVSQKFVDNEPLEPFYYACPS
jgi:hypothetical protein